MSENSPNLLIKPLNSAAKERYQNHGHFHDGDAGLDLYTLEELRIEPGETSFIKFGVSCQPVNGKAYFLIPRSSISKTPLRMANSIGLIDGGYVAVGVKTIQYYDAWVIKLAADLLNGIDEAPVIGAGELIPYVRFQSWKVD